MCYIREHSPEKALFWGVAICGGFSDLSGCTALEDMHPGFSPQHVGGYAIVISLVILILQQKSETLSP